MDCTPFLSTGSEDKTAITDYAWAEKIAIDTITDPKYGMTVMEPKVTIDTDQVTIDYPTFCM
jgi:hypothetical protein